MSQVMPAVAMLPSGIDLRYLETEDSDNESTMELVSEDLIFKHNNNTTFASGQSFDSDNSNASSHPESSDIEILMNTVSYSKHVKDDFTLPTSPAPIPRSRTPVEGLSGTVSDLTEHIMQVTPTKPPSENDDVDPLTPTANLKILMSAASPEIRNREKLKQMYPREMDTSSESQDSSDSLPVQPEKGNHSFEESKFRRHLSCDDQMLVSSEVEVGDGMNQAVSRKEKSLGLLCQRFLSKYPEYPGQLDRFEISLDEVAKELAVERRRIYDIVNVLESVEIVSRVAKNRYMWHGKTNLKHTLARLKTIGQMEGFAEQIERMRKLELSPGGSVIMGSRSPRKRLPFQSNEDSNLQADGTLKDNLRKEKSLGIMSQKFLMLFLVAKNHTVNLDLSAKILIGDSSTEKAESSLKTKVRRLYDIANILTSLDLIRKVRVTEFKGRKPAFRYVGPDVDELRKVTACTGDGCHRPSSRHSLLDCIQNPQVCSMLNAHKSLYPASRMSLLSQPLDLSSKQDKVPSKMKRPFSRHASFEQICEVAEQERNRLYFESKSQPSSPTKSKRPILPKRIPSMPCPKPQPVISTPNQSIVKSSIRQLVMQRVKQEDVKHEHGEMKEIISGVLPKSNEENLQNPVLKTQIGQPTGIGKTFVKLTRDQLEAMLQKFNNGNGNIEQADAATQSSPGLAKGLLSIIKANDASTVDASTSRKRVNIDKKGSQVKIVRVQSFPPPTKAKLNVSSSEDSTPPFEISQPSKKRLIEEPSAECYFEAKRPRLEVHSSVQDAEVAKINQSRALQKEPQKLKRSPMRALHMDPEFQMCPSQVEVPVQRTPTPEIGMESLKSNKKHVSHLMHESQPQSAIETKLVFHVNPTAPMSTETSSLGSTPTFRISNTSPPVMFLTTPPTGLSPDVGSLGLENHPMATPPGFNSVSLQPSHITPTSLTVGSSGIGALKPSALNPSALSPAILTGLISPVPISASPMGFITTPSTIDNITPVTTMPRLKKNGIMPSSGTIINLIPHLDNSPPHLQTRIPYVGSGLGFSRGDQKIPSAMIPQTQVFSSSGNSQKTPVGRTGDFSIISPSVNNTTPSSQFNKPLATPTSFFRSTPCSMAPVMVPRFISGRNNSSAFQIVVSEANGATVLPEGMTIARRLALHHEDTV